MTVLQSKSEELSFELLEMIFMHCLPDSTHAPSLHTAPLLLCHICSEWRAAAFSIPALWRILSLHLMQSSWDPDQDIMSAVNLAKLWLENSRSLSLSLILEHRWDGSTDIHPLEDVFLLYSNYIRRLTIDLRSKECFARFFALPPERLQQLEYISYSCKRIAATPIFQSTPPRLHIVRSIQPWYTTSWIDLPPSQLRHLTHLDIRNGLLSSTWRELFHQCPLLERCHMCVCFRPEESATVASGQAIKLEMQHLVDLRVSQEMIPFDGWFHDVSFPALKELELHFVDVNPSFLNALHMTLPVSSLLYLALNARFTTKLSDILPLLSSAASVQVFVLQMNVYVKDDGPLWDALTYPPNGPTNCALPRLQTLEWCMGPEACQRYDVQHFKRMERGLRALKSRWENLCCSPDSSSECGVARLQRVSIRHRCPYFGASMQRDIKAFVNSEIFEGLDLRIDTTEREIDRAEMW